MNVELIKRLLDITAFDNCDIIWWRYPDNGPRELQFFVNCNDTFAWACADCEQITLDNIDILEQSIKDEQRILGTYTCTIANELFSARVRKMRPQGASYIECYDKRMWSLFDACGPVRKVNFGNPKEHPVEASC